MEKKFKIQKILLSLTGCIGFISVLTPVMFHVSPNYLYHFWAFGLVFGSALRSDEVVVYSNFQTEFLIPALFAVIVILVGCGLIFKSTFKISSRNDFNGKLAIIGGILMISTPVLLLAIWYLLHILDRGYSIFWGPSDFTPSFSIYIQFFAGMSALILSLFMKKKKRPFKKN
ncbi:hypothetical protein NEF87_003111 [Candidatus Lokiarchaeum ossiferum]|uniref:Uncharacterized protein n=1 Tax=Candidatus Lokiarchaeum ossiferum TaxID=2951803 RepID=A0ABY6HTI3_9ARCH|nr:hypothetical protein NEF87_003111 [Candidatus Lokiarchaeum sp. B-35]